MKNPLSIRASFLTPAVCLLAFASQVVAQNAQQGASGSSSQHSLYEAFKGGDVSYQLGRGVTLSAANAEDFSLNVGGQIQAGFSAIDDDDPISNGSDNSNGFAINKARLSLRGNVFNENITYFVQADWANAIDTAQIPVVFRDTAAEELVDAWVGWRMNDSINIRVGQQKMRSSLQADASLTDNVGELVTNSIATGWFAGRRATGVLIEGRNDHFNWHVGAMNNSTAGIYDTPFRRTQNNQSRENALNYTAGFSVGSDRGTSESWSEGDLAQSGSPSWIAGINLHLENRSDTVENPTLNYFGAWKSGSGIAAQAEVFVREDGSSFFASPSIDSEGLYGQLSYTMPASDGVQYGGVARYSMMDFRSREAHEVSMGVNAYYHEHALKTQLQFTLLSDYASTAFLSGRVMTLDLMFTLMF